MCGCSVCVCFCSRNPPREPRQLFVSTEPRVKVSYWQKCVKVRPLLDELLLNDISIYSRCSLSFSLLQWNKRNFLVKHLFLWTRVRGNFRKKKYFVCITYLNEQSYNNNKINNGVMGTTYLDIYNGGLWKCFSGRVKGSHPWLGCLINSSNPSSTSLIMFQIWSFKLISKQMLFYY